MSSERKTSFKRLSNAIAARPKTLVMILVLAIVFGPYFYSRIFAPINRIRMSENEATKVAAPKGSFSICCFNIAHGRGATDDNWEQPGSQKPDRLLEIASFLKDLDADVVVLNEVDFRSTWSGNQNQAVGIAEAAGYRFCVQQRNLDFKIAHLNWSFGNAILSKFPITSSQSINYPPTKTWEDWLVGCKRGLACEIRLSNDESIRVAGVHLEHRSESTRLASAKMIYELADSGGPPLFAAGDFNSTPTGFPNSQQTKLGENALDWLIATGSFQHRPNPNPNDEELTFSTYSPESVIDWILIPTGIVGQRKFTFTEYHAIATDLSDHRAVLAKITFDSASSR